MITNLVALWIVTNAVRLPCPYCDTGSGFQYAVYHEHAYKAEVVTNYLPVVVDARDGCAREAMEMTGTMEAREE